MDNLTACDEFHTDKYKKVVVVAGCMGSFSLLASLTVICLMLLLKKHNFFIQRLILYLCVCAALNSASIILRFSRLSVRAGEEEEEEVEEDFDLFPSNSSGPLQRLCEASAFIDQTTLWSLNLAFLCLTFNMLIVTLFNRSTKRLELAYIFFIFIFPMLFNWVPFLEHSYGESGAWCWIRTRNPNKNCNYHELGRYLSWGLWYGPHYLLLALVCCCYIVAVMNVLRKRHHWRGVYSTDAEMQADQQKIKELVMPIIFYPLGFLLLNLFPFINRIYYAATGWPSYPLWILHATFSPLQGGYIALVYVLDKDTLRRLSPRELWGYVKHRKTPVKDYPATRGFTDSYEANRYSPDGSNSDFEDIEVALNRSKTRSYSYGSTESWRPHKPSVKSEKL